MSVSFPSGGPANAGPSKPTRPGFSLGGKGIRQSVPSEYNTEQPPAARQELTIFGREVVDVCVKFHAVRGRRARLA
jgi:hypothetical protein